jgi:CBS domain-containing protein
MKNTKVKDIMTASPILVSPNSTLEQAAFRMKDYDCGMLPVGTAGHLEGVITDRDIVLRAVAEGKDITIETVKNYMSHDIFACSEEDIFEDAIEKMQLHQVSRLIVKDKKGKASGILSFGGILRKSGDVSKIATIVKRAVGSKDY